ncbi:MAG: hypothetical protein ACRDVP_01840 [Acidimicrobiales bacterium]
MQQHVELSMRLEQNVRDQLRELAPLLAESNLPDADSLSVHALELAEAEESGSPFFERVKAFARGASAVATTAAQIAPGILAILNALQVIS